MIGRRRFAREVRALQELDSPHIVEILDSSSHDEPGDAWYTMELASDGTLRDRIGSDWTLEEKVAAFLHICLGLESAHQANLVHRDLKPENVPVFPGPVYKVADFGLLRRRSLDTTTITTDGQFIGTMMYWSPEHSYDPRTVGPKSDIFTLGVMLFEMLTGRLPRLHGQSTEEVLKPLSGPLVPLLRSLLQPRQDRRPRNIQEVLSKLKTVCGRASVYIEGLTDPPSVQKEEHPDSWSVDRRRKFELWISSGSLTERQVEAICFVINEFKAHEIDYRVLQLLALRMKVTHLTASRHFYNACRKLGINGIGAARDIRRGDSTPWPE